jgi:WD40 repeat protein
MLEAVARLQHPNIVQVFEVGRENHCPFIALEYVGSSLARRLRGIPQPARLAAELVETLARAIHHAHERGIVHRDLKPGNVLLTADGVPKISDFGLAKIVAGEAALTQPGAILGTPSYMAPEQVNDQRGPVGPVADVYALGAILYELLTGRPPFRAATTADTLLQVVAAEPVPPSRLQPKVPRDLETVCLKCLAKEPRRRYVSALALAEDLCRFLTNEPIQARPTPGWERGLKWAQRRPAAAALLGVSLLSGVGLLAGILWYNAGLQGYNTRLQEALVEVKKERDQTRLNLYVKDMLLARQAWEDAQVGRMLELLTAYQEAPAEVAALRGFEWHYHWRLGHSERFTLAGHAGEVRSVVYSPDGRRLASAGQDRLVKLWDVATGGEVFSLAGHQGRVTGLAFSPDSKILASTSEDRTVRLWDVVAGKELQCFKLTALGTCVAFGSAGQRVAAGAQEETVKVWKVATGEEVFTLRGKGVVRAVAFSRDGKQLAVAGDHAVQLWDATIGTELRTFLVAGSCFGVAFSPDGRHVTAANRAEVRLWETTTGKALSPLKGHAGVVTSVTFNPNGRRLASAGRDQTVKVWDMTTGREVRTFKGHTGAVHQVAFHPDRRHLASASADQTVKVWDTSAAQEFHAMEGPTAPVNGIAFSPDGRRLAAATYREGVVKVWDATTGAEIFSLSGNGGPVWAVAFSADSRHLASADDDGTVRWWDVATGQELPSLRGHIGAVWGVAFGPDNRHVASAGNDGTVRLWDVGTGREMIPPLRGHAGGVWGVAVGPNGQRLASAGNDGTVRLWDATTGREEWTLRGHAGAVRAVVFSFDGRCLASAGEDQTIRIWDPEAGALLRTLSGHAGIVRSVVFSPDGRRLASAGEDRTVRVWETATGQEVLSLKGHAGRVTGVTFSSDGWRLASGGLEGTVKVWDATPWTAEEWERYEARRIVQSLFVRGLSSARVIAALREDAALAEGVRQQALDLAEPYGQTLMARGALRLVQRLYAQPLLRPEVLAAIRADPALSEPVRRQALTLAEHHPENSSRLNDASWDVVRRPGADVAAYRLALRQAEAGCRGLPGRGGCLNTLGAAQYRLGMYREAVATLTEAYRLNATEAPRFGSAPVSLALLAMAHYRLDHREEARATLARLREALKQPQGAKDQEAQLFLREAEALVQEPAP